MPFSTTQIRPSINSRLTVRFSGLLLLKPGPDANTCEIGVHRTAEAPHTFQVMLIINKPGQPPTLLRLLTGPLTEEFNILVQPPITGFQIFERDHGPFDRSDGHNDAFDSRWTLDMNALHEGVDFNDGARPVVRLNDGTLYTGNLTREDLGPVLGQQNTNGEPLFRIAADLAAAIDMRHGTTVTLSTGDVPLLELPRSGEDPGTTYTIVLVNEPPGLGGEDHDEFAEYYQVLEVNGAQIPEADRFLLDYEGQPVTDEIPCMPTIINPPGTGGDN